MRAQDFLDAVELGFGLSLEDRHLLVAVVEFAPAPSGKRVNPVVNCAPAISRRHRTTPLRGFDIAKFRRKRQSMSQQTDDQRSQQTDDP